MDNRLIPIGVASKLLGVSIDTLRNWDKKNILNSFRPEPTGNRYYLKEDIGNFINKKTTEEHISLAIKWAVGKTPPSLPSDLYCETIDVFSARVQSLNLKFEREGDLKEISSLLTAIIGEIGNNYFNHNIGNWPDTPGVFFGYSLKNRQIVLADRGQGVLKTLKRVLPRLKTDAELELSNNQKLEVNKSKKSFHGSIAIINY